MTRDDAAVVVGKLTAYWPQARIPGAGIDAWAEDLRSVRYEAACTALVRLRRRLDRPPTIAQFLAEVRQLDTARPAERTPCVECGDTGYAAETWHTVRGRKYAFAAPCACEHGTHRRQMHARYGRDLTASDA